MMDTKLNEFVVWMEAELVPTLSPPMQTSFFQKVKANWEKAEAMKSPGVPNPMVHIVIGPRCLKMRDDILHTLHYLEKTPVPMEEIVRFRFFPSTDLIDEPERMFREASREHMVTMFKYFAEFGRLYYQYLVENDPVLASMVAARKEKGKEKEEGSSMDSK